MRANYERGKHRGYDWEEKEQGVGVNRGIEGKEVDHVF